jgi:hypothetical protein
MEQHIPVTLGGTENRRLGANFGYTGQNAACSASTTVSTSGREMR